MKEQIKNFLNEEQDPKAVEKVTNKLRDLLMRGEEISYIGVQKKPVTVLPDSIVLTNKRIIICKPKNLGLSMDFTDYAWDDIAGVFVKENILGSDFSFATKTDIQVSIDYIPKTQARKIYTFAKEQLEMLKEGNAAPSLINETEGQWIQPQVDEPEVIEEVETEEVTHFAELIPTAQKALAEEFTSVETPVEPIAETVKPAAEKSLSELTKDELFDKLQNYKKLLDNGLIRQAEYDNLKSEILPYL
ncbi:PH domain-containing protein [Flavobacterium silvaticum]|uniref:YokE-like PH domain-containing protein n=1 Tax=Flavobacterium silvaticum TaxID=1852020 RepID=A0A972FMM3_9FLAO|nr:PH domain-containing protein [Flavobacterium silvaticum]NMH28472.1 hypothetical protein [Flavobacterium silvaticum]